MSSSDADLPANWREVVDPEHLSQRYDAQSVTVFTNDDETVSVYVMPTGPNLAHAESDVHQIAVVPGSPDNFDHFERFAEAEGNEAALKVAHRFIRAYEDRAADDRTDENAIEAAKREVAEK
jgi:hypothetical protein